MIEAYETDGWRGAARERFKPTADLARARRQVGQHNKFYGHGQARARPGQAWMQSERAKQVIKLAKYLPTLLIFSLKMF